MPYDQSRLWYYKRRLSESINRIFSFSNKRDCGTRRSGLPIRVPVSLELIQVHPVYSALQQILNSTFLNLCALNEVLLRLDPTGGRGEPSSSLRTLSLTIDLEGPQTYSNYLEDDVHIAQTVKEKITVLYYLRRSLAIFLSQYFTEVQEFGETMAPDTDKPFGTLLIHINDFFSKLEVSIHSFCSDDPLTLDKLEDYKQMWPEPGTWDLLWADCDTDKAVSLIYENLNKLDTYVSMMVSKYRKPSKITQHWMRYTFGAIGISIFSVWLIRSGIIDNLVLGAKKIFSEEQALTAARDEFLETMRTRQKEEIEQLKSTSSELRSMLLDFSERIKGEKSPSNVSDHEKLEMARTSFEEQLRYPIRNSIWGELPRLLHIHILQITHDMEASMCKVHHEMLKDYEATSAILSYMPGIFISFGVLMISRTWAKQTKAKGRIARVERRLLLDELEERIREFENSPLVSERDHHINGLLLFTLDHLYRVVERHAKAAGEWQRVRDDLTLLWDPYLNTSDKLHVISRLNNRYHCLQPLTRNDRLLKQYTTWKRDLARKKLRNQRSGMDNESMTPDDYNFWVAGRSYLLSV